MDARTPNALDISPREGRGARETLPRGDVAREYAALRTGVMLIDRSTRARTSFGGAAAAEVLTGLVTNDVLVLSHGLGQYAAVLTPKGKIIADVRVFARESDLLVDAPARAAAGWWTTVRKFVNPRISRYTDLGASLHDLGAFGVGSRALVSRLLALNETDVGGLAPYAHQTATYDGSPVMVVRVPDAGLEGYELFAPAELVRSLWDAAVQHGATPAGSEAFDLARIEAGRPEWGIDMDETTLPQEANLDELHAISYTKGCYTGQETVARVHFRGHVNRQLRGLRFDGSTMLVRGAELVDEATGRTVGDVRSAAVSPRLGGVALGMVRREVAPESWLSAQWAGASVAVNVVALPFPL